MSAANKKAQPKYILKWWFCMRLNRVMLFYIHQVNLSLQMNCRMEYRLFGYYFLEALKCLSLLRGRQKLIASRQRGTGSAAPWDQMSKANNGARLKKSRTGKQLVAKSTDVVYTVICTVAKKRRESLLR